MICNITAFLPRLEGCVLPMIHTQSIMAYPHTHLRYGGAAATPVLLCRMLKRIIWFINRRPIVHLIVLGDFSFPLAGRTSSYIPLAVVLAFCPRIVFIERLDLICKCRTLDFLSVADIIQEVLKSIFAVRAVHHPHSSPTGRAVITAITCTYRTAHRLSSSISSSI